MNLQDKATRDKLIYTAFLRDVPKKALAREYNLTQQRICGIIKEQEKKAKRPPQRKLKLGVDYVKYKLGKLHKNK